MVTQTKSFDASNATTNGVSSLSGDDVTVYNSATMGGQAGSVFFDDRIKLDEDFTVTFDGVWSGPDGIAFVLHNDPAGASAIGGGGIGMGHAGIQNGIAIEFDTFFNGADFNNVDINDNSSVIRDTDFAANDPNGNLTTQVDLDPIANLKDGAPHSIQIDWDASTRTFTWTVDGQAVATESFTQAEITALFGGTDRVYVGLTGAKFEAGSGVANDFAITGSFVCFTTGTLILTNRGEVPVETLKAGDWVQTLDNGLQKISWIGSRDLDVDMLAQNPKLRPIRIKAGALAKGVPETDLIVSPQHRMLLSSKIAERMFDTAELLVPAVKLLGLDGVEQVEDASGISYWHILTENHELLIANGAPAESLYLGPQARLAMSAEAMHEIQLLFPELSRDDYVPVKARQFAQGGKRLKNLLSRHIKNRKPLVDMGALAPKFAMDARIH